VTDLRIPGDFAVCNIGGGGGVAIDFMQWLNGATAFSHWDHALVYLGQGMVLQAEPHGAQIVSRPVRAGDLWSTSIAALALTHTQQARVWGLAQSLEGTPYSALDYLALAARRARIPAPHLRAFLKTQGHAMCSELVDLFRMRLGSHLFRDDRWEGDVTPWDLGHLLVAAGALPAK
jgi:hypothetical protein